MVKLLMQYCTSLMYNKFHNVLIGLFVVDLYAMVVFMHL
jgi:hypothetical protein